MKSLLCKILLLMAAVLLSACSAQSTYSFDESHEQAIADGMLLPIDTVADIVDENVYVHPVGITNTAFRREIPVRAEFHVRKYLRFQHMDRYFGEFYVEVGQLVAAGDVLASSQSPEPSIMSLALLRQARQDLGYFEAAFTREYYRRLSEIEDTRLSVYTEPDGEWERYAIRLAMKELNLESFVADAARSRRYMREEIEEMESLIASEQLIAPFDGLVVFIANISSGDNFGEGQRIIGIVDTDSLVFTASRPITVPAYEWDVLIRYGDVFPFSVSREEIFYVRAVNDPIAANRYPLYYLAPLNPEDIESLLHYFEGCWMSLTSGVLHVHPTWNRIGEIIAVPELAVHSETHAVTERHFVFVYEDGQISRRFVLLAPYVSIVPERRLVVISGLTPEQRVWREPRR